MTVLVSPNDLVFLAKTAGSCLGLEGDMVEVGVYEGGTAKVISEVKGNKKLYLFDTFEGLQKCNPALDGLFTDGQYTASEEAVVGLLKDYKDVEVKKGWFPDSAECLKEAKICFCHLDTDTYESTKGCLEFIYPRMVSKGIILIHDYPGSFIGITKAVNEFFSDKTEKPQRVGEFYGMITKE